MKSFGAVVAMLLLFGGAGAQFIEVQHRAATPAQRASLKTWLQPRIASGEVDGSSLEIEVWRDKKAPVTKWQVEATAWTPSTRMRNGLCTAQQLHFEAIGARWAWQPSDPARVRHVWQADPSACERQRDLVSVDDGLDEARVAMIVRGDDHLHDRMLAMAKAACGQLQSGLHLVGIERQAPLEPGDQDPYPKLGVSMRGDGSADVQMSIRFGPRGAEPWQAMGCARP